MIRSGIALPDRLLVPAAEMWHPRFQLVNCESSNCFVEPLNKTRLIVYDTGEIDMVLNPLLTGSCEMQLDNACHFNDFMYYGSNVSLYEYLSVNLVLYCNFTISTSNSTKYILVIYILYMYSI